MGKRDLSDSGDVGPVGFDHTAEFIKVKTQKMHCSKVMVLISTFELHCVVGSYNELECSQTVLGTLHAVHISLLPNSKTLGSTVEEHLC